MTSEHEPTGRSVALSAAIEEAIAEAEDDSSRWYSGFDRSDVEKRIRRQYDADVSQRTVDRALKDAAALGWVADERQGWDAGGRAEDHVADEDEADAPV